LTGGLEATQTLQELVILPALALALTRAKPH